MSYYEARLLRYNPEEDDKEDDSEGMSGSTIALISVGLLALAGGGYWFFSKKKAEAAAAESAAVASGEAPPSADTQAANEQAKAAAVAAAGSDRNAIIAAEAQYPTVSYLNGSKGTVTKAEADQMVASGKFAWNALRTNITEKDPNAPGKIFFAPTKPIKSPPAKPKKKKGKK